MNEVVSKPEQSAERPRWLRYFPFYILSLLVLWLAVNRAVVNWLQTTVGLDVVWSSLIHVGVIVALVGVPFYFVLLDEQRRNRE